MLGQDFHLHYYYYYYYYYYCDYYLDAKNENFSYIIYVRLLYGLSEKSGLASRATAELELYSSKYAGGVDLI